MSQLKTIPAPYGKDVVDDDGNKMSHVIGAGVDQGAGEQTDPAVEIEPPLSRPGLQPVEHGPDESLRGSRVRLVARADVVSDGVSEAGVPAATIAAALGRLYEVELVTFADDESFDWSALPQDGRFTILASTSRRRYGARARAGWRSIFPARSPTTTVTPSSRRSATWS